MRILITEDDRAIRRAIRDILEMEGHQIDEAENGEEALKKFEDVSFMSIDQESITYGFD